MEKMIGVIFGVTSPHIVQFAAAPTDKMMNVWRGQFVMLHDPIQKDKRYLGRVLKLERRNLLMDETMAPQLVNLLREPDLALEDIGFRRDIGEVLIGEVEIMGVRKNGIIEHPKYPFAPGTRIYKADVNFLREQLKPSEESISIGTLRDETDVQAYLDYQELVSKHFSVLAMTGGGKSYTVGVIIESLAKDTKLPIVIFDPHSEYSSLLRAKNDNGKVVSQKVKIFTTKNSSSEKINERFKDRFGINRAATDIYIQLADLESYQITHLLKILYDLSDPQRRVLEAVWEEVREERKRSGYLTIEDIKEIIDREGAGVAKEIAVRMLKTKLELLYKSVPFFKKDVSQPEIEIADLVKINRISVVDLAGLSLPHQQALIAVLSSQILEKRMEGGLPPAFLVFEEAHRFVPTGSIATASKPTILKIAQEGRKFLIGMALVSQRPSALDDDALSQCNTQIILRLTNPVDQSYVRKVSEWVTSEDLEEVRALPPGEAYIFGPSVRVSLPVKIRERWTEHGGMTPKIKEELEKF